MGHKCGVDESKKTCHGRRTDRSYDIAMGADLCGVFRVKPWGLRLAGQSRLGHPRVPWQFTITEPVKENVWKKKLQARALGKLVKIKEQCSCKKWGGQM